MSHTRCTNTPSYLGFFTSVDGGFASVSRLERVDGSRITRLFRQFWGLPVRDAAVRRRLASLLTGRRMVEHRLKDAYCVVIGYFACKRNDRPENIYWPEHPNHRKLRAGAYATAPQTLLSRYFLHHPGLFSSLILITHPILLVEYTASHFLKSYPRPWLDMTWSWIYEVCSGWWSIIVLLPTLTYTQSPRWRSTRRQHKLIYQNLNWNTTLQRTFLPGKCLRLTRGSYGGGSPNIAHRVHSVSLTNCIMWLWYNN